MPLANPSPSRWAKAGYIRKVTKGRDFYVAGTSPRGGDAMKKIVAVAVLAAMTMLGAVAAAYADGRHRVDGRQQEEVSSAQYHILLGQCRFGDTAGARAQCRTDVKRNYRIGARNPDLDCRTYSSVSVCGELTLSPREQACVSESVGGGLTFRRAEVECYAFG
ncbi:hypothetical protein Psi02_20880 [Planotetraspora silvatica]|uniref:Uncharacterized protein n=2 Tax=Planotetraspora silvatica TaxID=234614 RepID=A0A8J3XLJ6_9ACTN|nr:hypothetical protein Psi02_20880 [Planotetraspora silvatica]